jgi:hypothetical protein
MRERERARERERMREKERAIKFISNNTSKMHFNFSYLRSPLTLLHWKGPPCPWFGIRRLREREGGRRVRGVSERGKREREGESVSGEREREGEGGGRERGREVENSKERGDGVG